MTPQSPGSYRRVAIAVVVVAILIGSGIDLTISRAVRSSSSASTFCTVPDTGELMMRVLNSSDGQPISSLPVQVEEYYPDCIPPSLRTVSTNGSGIIAFGGVSDDYNLSVSYNHENFTTSTYIGPGTLTCVTLAVPSGDLEISHLASEDSSCESSVTTTSTYIPSNGLGLQVELNSTEIRSGEAVAVEVMIVNPSGRNVTVVPDYQTNTSIFVWNSYDFSCGGVPGASPTWSLAGYAVFQGHYTSGNLSSAGSPLSFVAPVIYGCPAFADPSSVTFLPNGTTVAYFSQQGLQPMKGNATMNATTQTCVFGPSSDDCKGVDALFGYWTGPIEDAPNYQTSDSKYFHYFPPGEYTIVAADMWGQSSFSYFRVT